MIWPQDTPLGDPTSYGFMTRNVEPQTVMNSHFVQENQWTECNDKQFDPVCSLILFSWSVRRMIHTHLYSHFWQELQSLWKNVNKKLSTDFFVHVIQLDYTCSGLSCTYMSVSLTQWTLITQRSYSSCFSLWSVQGQGNLYYPEGQFVAVDVQECFISPSLTRSASCAFTGASCFKIQSESGADFPVHPYRHIENFTVLSRREKSSTRAML